MKTRTASALLIAALMLDACEPAATFDKPQPDNVKALPAFPGHMQGRYIAADRASVLAISDELITRQYDFDLKEHKDSIGSSYRIVGDELVNLGDGTTVKILLEGDTLIQHKNWMDTLFHISADNVLKKFKGHYFLNCRYGEGAWEVKKVALQNGTLTVGSISDKAEVQRLKEITETVSDTTSTHFVLTRRQFKEFVKQDGFGARESFERLSENKR